MERLLCNALAHVIYLGVPGQCWYTIHSPISLQFSHMTLSGVWTTSICHCCLAV